ncbi:MAG: hypothetical protein H7Y42_17045 [Chitinophagaceae bacterium]|nr:hypothetical protein [Chitinophagaceae bacterium]
MKNTRLLSIFNFLSLLAHVGMAYATQSKLVNDNTVGEVSDQYPSLFTPIGFTFAIWGVIYTALIAFCIYHLVMAFAKPSMHPENKVTNRMGLWFILNNIAAVAWLAAWTDDLIGASTILILIQLVSLMAISIRTRIHDPRVSISSKIFTQFPISIYFGWITIAAIANIAVYLVSTGWDGFGWGYSPVTWTQFIIGLAILVTIVVVLSQRNVFYGLVVMWALYGIIVKRESIDSSEYSAIIQTAWIGIAVVGIVSLIQLVNNVSRKRVKEKPSIDSRREAMKG